MTRGRLLWEVTRWELLRWLKLADMVRTLVISCLLGLAVWGGLAWYEKHGREPVRLAVLGSEALTFEPPAGGDLVIDDSAWAGEDEALRALMAREIDAVLLLRAADDAELVVVREPVWKSQLEEALSEAYRRLKFRQAGIAPERLDEILAPVRLAVTYHESADPPSTLADKVAAGLLIGLTILGVFTGVAYQFVVITGEKRLRVTELVISAISPQTWIDGKILGISLLAFATTATYVTSGVAFAAVSKIFGDGLELPVGFADPGLWIAASLLALAGFLMWNTFFGLVAATIDDPNTSARGSLMLLPVLPLALGLLGLAQPDAAWMRLLSILPPTSPTLLTLRLVLGEVGWWEVALALALLAAASWLLRRAAGRVFALGILMYGKEPSWRETWRWIRET